MKRRFIVALASIGLIAACDPSGTVVASGLDGVQGVVANGGEMIFTNPLGGPYIGSVATAGGESPTTIVQGPPIAYLSVSDGTNLYFTDGATLGGVYRVSLTGGQPTLLASGSGEGSVFGLGQPSGLAVDDQNVYWANNLINGAGSIMALSKGGGGVVTLASGQSGPLFVAIDSTSVYWTASAEGTVKKLPLGGGTAVILSSSGLAPQGLAVDSENVYWVDNQAGTLSSVPLTGGKATQMAGGLNAPLFLCLSEGTLYWSTLDSIQKLPTVGGSVSTVASTDGPMQVAVSGAQVYWADSINGQILSAPR